MLADVKRVPAGCDFAGYVVDAPGCLIETVDDFRPLLADNLDLMPVAVLLKIVKRDRAIQKDAARQDDAIVARGGDVSGISGAG